MNNEKILKQAIEKAEKNGFSWGLKEDLGLDFSERPEITSEHLIADNDYHPIIFSHDFAKAFWGEEAVTECCGDQNYEGEDGCKACGGCNVKFADEVPIWNKHLQQMVLEEYPIKYLKEFL